MRILVATGVYPPDLGGPANYAFNLTSEFERLGHTVRVLNYRFEKRLPWGFRQIWYFARIFSRTFSADFIVAFDTVSVGIPAVIASFILNRKIVVRIGGDFLWESYVERTGLAIPLSEFYKVTSLVLTKKEIVLRRLQQFVLDYSDFIVFSTEWQRNIWASFYNLSSSKVVIIENYFPPVTKNPKTEEKKFIFAGRPIKLKNKESVDLAFAMAKKIDDRLSLEFGSWDRELLMTKIKDARAVVVPSVSEVSPNLIIEAISLGKTFILTKDTGYREKLNGLGIFVNPRDVEELKNAFVALSDDKIYGEYLNKVFNFKFTHSWKQIAAEFLSLTKKNG